MTLPNLPKQYDPRESQERWYPLWLQRGYFHARPESPAEPYSIVIPPPNVTGALHLGHALNNTIQDILIRWRRMQGYDTLWMPGTDHAGIATQAVVERRIFEEEKKTRHDIGREALVERIWAWKHEYEQRILGQLRLMGCSCDWDRTRFTLDDMCARAVRETFFHLFKAGKIFRGKRLINWDTQLRTAVADDEIEYRDQDGQLWTIKYPVTGSLTEALHVSTTRPETMLGDTAVAVHPDDARYKHLIGQTVDLPLTGRAIPIIADPILVDPAFGTGCVKVTPAHDPNDYQTGLRHKLEQINLLNPDGTYNENAGAYAGLDRHVVRKRVVADLKAQGLLEKVEPHKNRIGYSDRSKTVIEPYLSDQWFVRMGDDPDGTLGFAQQAMDAVTSERVTIHPERYAKSFLDWLGEKRDWCISRQLWWGHRIPVWSKSVATTEKVRSVYDQFMRRLSELVDRGGDETAEDVSWRTTYNNFFDAVGGGVFNALDNHDGVKLFMSWSEGFQEVHFRACVNSGYEEIETRLEKEFGFARDPDVLDTWFSSALWPHSTMGWPEATPELAKYYPTSVLSTARDIITLWVARMVIFGQFNTGDVPFRDVFIHPVIQDGDGKRMSKSAGNGIDPVDIIELYGADALRYTLASSATETQDLRMPVEQAKLPDGRVVNTSKRFEEGRTFPNKLWNVARFALMNLEGYEPGPLDPTSLQVEDRWILGRLAATAAEATADLESFRFAELSKRLRDFTWGEFCDWYVEFVKPRLRDPQKKAVAQGVLAAVLDGICRLLHPIMPFVTESIWQALGQIAPIRGFPDPQPVAESVCIALWPKYPIAWVDDEAGADVAQWQEKIGALRNFRAEKNLARDARLTVLLATTPPIAERLARGQSIIETLSGGPASLAISTQVNRPPNSAVIVLPDAELIIPLEGLVDPEAERAKHKKALTDLDKQLAGLRAKLANEGFIARAPADVVAQQRLRETELIAQRASLLTLLGEQE